MFHPLATDTRLPPVTPRVPSPSHRHSYFLAQSWFPGSAHYVFPRSFFFLTSRLPPRRPYTPVGRKR